MRLDLLESSSMLALVLMLAGLLVIGACATAAQRKAAESEAVQKEAAKEIRRICALHEAEREAKLKKIKDESGMVLVCGKERAQPPAGSEPG